MKMIVAGLMSLTAMGASIIAEVDPVTVVVRGGIAFSVGIALSGIWTSVVSPQAPKEKAKKPAKNEPAEVESDDEPESKEDVEEAA